MVINQDCQGDEFITEINSSSSGVVLSLYFMYKFFSKMLEFSAIAVKYGGQYVVVT